MKVLSIQQPWASLIVHGHKKIETRTWATKYCGPLLIHAATKWSIEQNNICCDYQDANVFYPALAALGFAGGRNPYRCGLPFGAIIGQVNLVHVVKTEELEGYMFAELEHKDHRGVWRLTPQERVFGDYSPGRYGWLLSNPVLFDEPIPAKGKLNIWNWGGPTPSP